MSTPISGPRGWPLFGVVLPFGKDPLGYLERMQREYGDLSRYRLGPLSVLQVNHPDAIEQVLVTNHRHFIKDVGTRDLMPIVGRGLLTSEGELWKRQRKAIAPMLQRAKIGRYGEAMTSLTAAWEASLAPDVVQDVRGDLMHLTLSVVMRALFDEDAGPMVERVGHAVDVLMIEFVETIQSWKRALPSWWPVAGRKRFAGSVTELRSMATAMIEGKRASAGSASGSSGDDMVSRLLALRLEDGTELSTEQIADELLTMLLAGHETTALALTYALHLLVRHPEVLERAHAELDAALGARDPTIDDADALPFTKAIFLETLRLYPPAWAIGREAIEPTEVSGHAVRVGEQLFISQWVVHHDPRWWPEPLAFRPERWLDGSANAVPRFAYFPFGGGPRVCIGNHFAEMEGVLVLATLLRRRTVEAVAECPPLELLPSVTIRPKNPVLVRLKRRVG